MASPTVISPSAASPKHLSSGGLSPLLLQHFAQDRSKDARKIQLGAGMASPAAKLVGSSSLPNLATLGAATQSLSQWRSMMEGPTSPSSGKPSGQVRAARSRSAVKRSASEVLSPKGAQSAPNRRDPRGDIQFFPDSDLVRRLPQPGEPGSPKEAGSLSPSFRAAVRVVSPRHGAGYTPAPPQSWGPSATLGLLLQSGNQALQMQMGMSTYEEHSPDAWSTPMMQTQGPSWTSPTARQFPGSPTSMAQTQQAMPFREALVQSSNRLQHAQPSNFAKLSPTSKRMAQTVSGDRGMELPSEINDLKMAMEGLCPSSSSSSKAFLANPFHQRSNPLVKSASQPVIASQPFQPAASQAAMATQAFQSVVFEEPDIDVLRVMEQSYQSVQVHLSLPGAERPDVTEQKPQDVEAVGTSPPQPASGNPLSDTAMRLRRRSPRRVLITEQSERQEARSRDRSEEHSPTSPKEFDKSPLPSARQFDTPRKAEITDKSPIPPSPPAKRDLAKSRSYHHFTHPKENQPKRKSTGQHNGCCCCTCKCDCDPFDNVPASDTLQQSMHLMDTLYMLRRQVLKQPPKSASVVPEVHKDDNDDGNDNAHGKATKKSGGNDDDHDGTLLKSIMGNKHDTEAVITEIIAALHLGTGEAFELGGERHPTNIISHRSLIVANRKQVMLHEIETRIATYEALNTKRNALLIQIAYQNGEVPPELLDMKQFISKYSNSPADPTEDPGFVDFPTFSEVFCLHAGHDHFKTLRRLGDVAGTWWADKCLELANKGGGDKNSRKARLAAMNGEKVDDSFRLGHAQLKKIFSIARGSGIDMSSPKMLEVVNIMNDRLAEAVLKDAQKWHEEDRQLAADRLAAKTGSKVPPVGVATTIAARIEGLVRECLNDGCPDCHPKLDIARNIAKTLYNTDGERKRLAAREKRLLDRGQPIR